MPNRLAAEPSPYLRQHAANPVDWHPWGPQALERARREDRPILLSIGYSACHWCHVMAHECFEDAGVADVMNRLFVNIKVDREERPDLDQIYQSAHQMLAGRAGGWPLTVFLAPDTTPFFAGTYFPREPRHGLPGFAQLCERVARAWREHRAEIAAQNEEVRQAFVRLQPVGPAVVPTLSAAPIGAALEELRATFDAEHGGFGTAPKFPHPGELELCLATGARDMTLVTLERICRGGVYDQLGGGFFRYSVDRRWEIPHFEKMLYDNGPLLGLLADAWLVSGEALYARCAAETAAWLEREMQSPAGGYYSSLDADSEGEEGRFYLWRREEVEALLAPEEYAACAPRYGLDRPANFERRLWHLVLADATSGYGAAAEAARAKLLAARGQRVRPARDEKVLASWNGLAIRGMARAARVFGRDDWLASARRALALIRTELWRDGRLHAAWKEGHAYLRGYLDDYAFVLAALLELMQVDFRSEDLGFARELAEVLIAEFEDEGHGGFFFTGRSHERLLHRPKTGEDHATPSGNGVAAWALARLAHLAGEPRYAEAARRTIALFYPQMERYPSAHATLCRALAEKLEPPRLLVLRGREPQLGEWQRALSRHYAPDGMLLALAARRAAGTAGQAVPRGCGQRMAMPGR